MSPPYSPWSIQSKQVCLLLLLIVPFFATFVSTIFQDDLLIYDFCTLQLICVIFIFYTLDSTTTRAGNYGDLRRFSGQYLDVNTNVINGLHLIKVAFQHIRNITSNPKIIYIKISVVEVSLLKYSSRVEYLPFFWSRVEQSTNMVEYYSSIWSILRSNTQVLRLIIVTLYKNMFESKLAKDGILCQIFFLVKTNNRWIISMQFLIMCPMR